MNNLTEKTMKIIAALSGTTKTEVEATFAKLYADTLPTLKNVLDYEGLKDLFNASNNTFKQDMINLLETPQPDDTDWQAKFISANIALLLNVPVILKYIDSQNLYTVPDKFITNLTEYQTNLIHYLSEILKAYALDKKSLN